MAKPRVKTAFAKDQLKAFVARVERLNEEREALNADIKEIYAEAKGMGFCTKTMRKVVGLRKLDKADYQEQEAMLDLYKDAVGLDELPLVEYAREPKAEPLPRIIAATKAAGPKVSDVVAKLAEEQFDPETGEITEIPAGPHAGDNGRPDTKVEEASSIPAHDRSGIGLVETTGEMVPASKPDAVAGASGPSPQIPSFLLRKQPEAVAAE